MGSHKAQLVAHVFTQECRIDYDETFTHDAQMTNVCTLIIVGVRRWPLYLMDGTPTHVCRLHRVIYSLKQTPEAWFECFCLAFL